MPTGSEGSEVEVKKLTEDEARTLALDILGWQMALQLATFGVFGVLDGVVRATPLGDIPSLVSTITWIYRVVAVVLPSFAPLLVSQRSGTPSLEYCRARRGALVLASAVGSVLPLCAQPFITSHFGHAAILVYLAASFLSGAFCLMTVTFGRSEAV